MGRSVSMMTESTIEELILDLDSLETATRLNARKSLVKLGSKAVHPLLATLQGDQIRQCADAVVILGEIGNEQSIMPLLNIRRHDHVLLRINSAKALGKLGDAQIEDYLIAWLNTEPEILVQMELVSSLVQIGSKKAVNVLVDMLTTTESSTLRYLSICLLSDIGDCGVVAKIRPYLNDPDHHVREYAKAAVDKLSNPAQKEISA